MTNRDERPPLQVAPEPTHDPDYDDPRSTGRTPPQDHAAEQAVLGALILAPQLATELETHLDVDDFYRPHHQTIWTACHAVAAQATGDLALDAITLADHLVKTGQLQAVGGAGYLHTLMEACPLPANAAAYAKIVRDTARLRAVTAAAAKLTQLGYAGDVARVDTYLGEALQTLDDIVMRFGPRQLSTTTTTGLADLSWILTGQRPLQPPPVYGRRTDGTALFYRGRVNGLFGDPESGKTWLAQIAMVEALNAGGTATMIDVDHNGQDHTAARLMLLGARPEHVADTTRFRYYEPEDAEELRAAITDVTNLAPDVVTLDSIGEMLPMLGVKSVDNDEITQAMRTIAMPPAKAGCCVITIDHLPKSAEARVTGYAIGGTAKKRSIDGSYIRVESKVKPTPGGIGRATLRIEKDRTGELRKTSGGGYAGTLTLDSTADQVTTWSIGREDSPITEDGRFRPTGVMEQVSRFIENNDQCKFTEIKLGVTAQDKTIRAAIKILLDEGFVSVMRGTKTHLHHSIALYREAEDDNL